MDLKLLKKLGFSDKNIHVYTTLLRLGPASIRNIAEETGINRGTVYDILKWLEDLGLVTRFAENKRKMFAPEDPSALLRLAQKQEKEMQKLSDQLEADLPAWQAVYRKYGEQPVAEYYPQSGIRHILEDVLKTCDDEGQDMYRIYSSAVLREYLYDNYAEFSDDRIKKGIKVQVIAIGKGGELRGLDERKWMDARESTPTYIIIYGSKTAYISFNAIGEAIGVVIANPGISNTQKIIFDELWEKL